MGAPVPAGHRLGDGFLEQHLKGIDSLGGFLRRLPRQPRGEGSGQIALAQLLPYRHFHPLAAFSSSSACRSSARMGWVPRLCLPVPPALLPTQHGPPSQRRQCVPPAVPGARDLPPSAAPNFSPSFLAISHLQMVYSAFAPASAAGRLSTASFGSDTWNQSWPAGSGHPRFPASGQPFHHFPLIHRQIHREYHVHVLIHRLHLPHGDQPVIVELEPLLQPLFHLPPCP